MKLFEITQQFRELEKLELDDDIPPEVIRDTLEGLTGDFTEKAVQVAAGLDHSLVVTDQGRLLAFGDPPN